jgi:hypothetical protein
VFLCCFCADMSVYSKKVAKLCWAGAGAALRSLNCWRSLCRAPIRVPRKIKDICCGFVGALSIFSLQRWQLLFICREQRFDKAIPIISSCSTRFALTHFVCCVYIYKCPLNWILKSRSCWVKLCDSVRERYMHILWVYFVFPLSKCHL